MCSLSSPSVHFHSLFTFPHSASTPSLVDDRLVNLLEELGLSKYVPQFIEEEWDWDSLLEITSNDLLSMGLKTGLFLFLHLIFPHLPSLFHCPHLTLMMAVLVTPDSFLIPLSLIVNTSNILTGGKIKEVDEN